VRQRPPCSTRASSCPTPGRCSCPNSNLTNLIVLEHLRITDGQFLARMWLAVLAAFVVTAAVTALKGRLI
jgi:hypothetical protein